MKILIPVDGLDDAKLIVDFVANYHWPPGSQFKIVHVLGSSNTEGLAKTAEADSDQVLKQVVAKLRPFLNGHEITCELLRGGAILEIVNASSQWHSDMIVMGYRTRGIMERLISGSVSNAVVMQAPCSVAIIRPPVKLDNS
jgi:nucleotide-binding universal stress UspA family protein